MAIQPKKHEEIHVTPDTIESSDSNKRDSRPNNGRRIIAGGLIGAAALGVLVGRGMAGGSEQEPGPEPAPPAATGEATPGAEGDTIETPSTPETSPTDIPTPSIENPTENLDINPTFLTVEEYEALSPADKETAKQMLWSHYDGLDRRWIEGTGPGAGIEYVIEFLNEKGAYRPVIENADYIIQSPGLQLEYVDYKGWTIDAGKVIGHNFKTFMNIYQHYRDELNLNVESDQLHSQLMFNGMGVLSIRGMAETVSDPTLCKDPYDCLVARDSADFRKLFNFMDQLPEGSMVLEVDIPNSPGRSVRNIEVSVLLPDGPVDNRTIEFEEGIELYPVEAPDLYTTPLKAASIDYEYMGAPYGHGYNAVAMLKFADEDLYGKVK